MRLKLHKKSGRGLPHSTTLREGPMRWKVRQLLDCGSPLPLFPLPELVGIMPHLPFNGSDSP